jgi:RNA polymerase sigma-70 factor (ECF subfamily)
VVSSVRERLDWFKEAILPHEAALRDRMRRIMPRRDDHDDLVAEAIARAYATQNFARITHGRAYLFQIARNMVIDEVRRDKIVSLVVLADLDLIAADTSTEAMLQARDELRRLEAIIDTLPIQCRRAFLLRRVHDKSVQEIADEMGLSVSTVDKHIGRAALKIMQAIGQYEDLGFGWSLQKRRGKAGDRSGGGTAVS